MSGTMRDLPRRPLVAILTATLLTLAAPAPAQEESFDFVFANPGARSTGLGGAFTALADDATAAYANPAGLVQLLRPEISAELRAIFDNNDEELDAFDTDSDLTGLGFVSFVMPLGDFCLAAYTHGVSSGDIVGDLFLLDEEGFTVNRAAVAGAYRLGERLSVGIGVSYFWGQLTLAGITSDRADDWGLNGGLLWSPTGWLNLGGFYREGPELDVLGSIAGSGDARLVFPDVYGAGVAVRPGEGHLAVSLEWDRVRPSTLLVAMDERLTSVETEAGDQLHLGLEYVVLEWKPVTAFRAGVWREPGLRALHAAAFQGRSVSNPDAIHGAFGFGLAWQHFQLDIGIDVAEVEATLSASVIVSF